MSDSNDKPLPLDDEPPSFNEWRTKENLPTSNTTFQQSPIVEPLHDEPPLRHQSTASHFEDFLAFRKMLFSFVIQTLFCIVSLIIIVGALVKFFNSQRDLGD